MSELMADLVLALREAQDTATSLHEKLVERDGQTADAARQIEEEITVLRQEVLGIEELPAERAGKMVEQLRGLLLRSTGDLQPLQPALVKAIASTLRGAE